MAVAMASTRRTSCKRILRAFMGFENVGFDPVKPLYDLAAVLYFASSFRYSGPLRAHILGN